jgi:hypothetical protein
MTRPVIEFNEKNHRYKVDGEYFPNVTTIIDSVVPKNLSWWAMVVGVNATCALIRQGYATPEDDPENIVTAIRENKLSVYHIRDEKGEEGTAVHQAADRYAKTGEIPRLKDYSSEVQPKIKALANFLLDVRPKILKSEERVASLVHKYAGTFDWLVDIEGQRGIVDLKTGKRVYPDSQFPQLAAYEQAHVEGGEAPTAFQAILHLGADGIYDFVESTDTFHDFKVLLDHYFSAKLREARIKALKVDLDAEKTV